MDFALLIAGLMVCITIVYTTLSGLIVARHEPSRTYAEVNLALACFSVVGGIYLMYAIFSFHHPEGLAQAFKNMKKTHQEHKYEKGKAFTHHAPPRLTPTSNRRSESRPFDE